LEGEVLRFKVFGNEAEPETPTNLVVIPVKEFRERSWNVTWSDAFN
jgi:hypothetical protein